MKVFQFITLSILIQTSVYGQVGSQIDTVSFDELLNKYKETIGWNFGDCYGEWGGTIYFFDKTSGKNRAIPSLGWSWRDSGRQHLW